jgi:hypothetical protein
MATRPNLTSNIVPWRDHESGDVSERGDEVRRRILGADAQAFEHETPHRVAERARHDDAEERRRWIKHELDDAPAAA